MKLATVICGLGVFFYSPLALAGPPIDFRGRNLDRSDVNYSNPVTSSPGQRVELRWISLLANSCQALWSPLPNGQPTPVAIDSFVVVAPNTTSSYTIRCADASSATEATVTVIVSSAGGTDTHAPSVSFVTPLNGATVSGITPIAVAANDNVAVAGVQIFLDSVPLFAEITQPPYLMSWNTTFLPNGLYTLTVRARDAAGNTAVAAVRVTVSNTPIVFSVDYPSARQVYAVGDRIIVVWSAHLQATSYTVWFSPSPTVFTAISPQLPAANRTTFAWTPTGAQATTTGKIIVVAQLANGLTAQAESGVFTITQEAVAVTEPSASSAFQAGSPINVRWLTASGTPVDYYLVDFSTNGGGTYTTVSPILPVGTLTFTFTPTAATDQAKFRVGAFLTTGVALFAESATFKITAAVVTPTFAANNVLNAADTDPTTAIRGTLVAGAWFAIYGANFANSEFRATSVPLPARLGDFEVLVNGQPSPLGLVKTDQINFQVPFWAAGAASLQVVNRSTGQTSAIASLLVAPSAPSLFKYQDSTGSFRPIVQNWLTAGLVSESSPVALSSNRFVILYGNAFGAVRDFVIAGQPSPASRLIDANSTFVIDGRVQMPAQIAYIGLAPGMVGVFQVNLELPADLSSGRHEGVLVISGRVLTFSFWSAP